MDSHSERAAVVIEALSWEGTAYHHGASIKGVGVDCAHMLAAVYGAQGTGLVDVGPLPEYSPDWFLHGATDLLRDWISRYCDLTSVAEPGDIALYRYGRFASHAGVVITVHPVTIVHAFRGRGVVREEADDATPLYARLDSYWTLARWSDAP